MTLEDGTFAVVRSDPRKPLLLEVIAIFIEASRARSYAEMRTPAPTRGRSHRLEAPKKQAVEATESLAELSSRQSAVLETLRAKMDANRRVTEKAATLAEATRIRSARSTRFVLQSLEKNNSSKRLAQL